MLLFFAFRYRPDWRASDPLKDRRKAHAGADAHRDDAIFEFRVALHGADQRRDADGAGGAERMAEGDRSAQRIDLLRVEIERAQAGDGLRCEGFVKLDPVEIVLLDPGELERPWDRFDRPDAHDLSRHAGDAVGHEAGQRFEIILLQNLFAHQDRRASAVGHLRSVSRSDAPLRREDPSQPGQLLQTDVRARPFIDIDGFLSYV